MERNRRPLASDLQLTNGCPDLCLNAHPAQALYACSGFLRGCVPSHNRKFGPVIIFDPPSDYKDSRTLHGRSLIIEVSSLGLSSTIVR